MKTPREFLFKRHEAAGGKLDAVRENVLATALADSTHGPEQSLPVSIAIRLWRELVWPCRRVWTGLAAVWLVIVALNVITGDDPAPRMAKNETSPPGPEVVAALREQRQLMAQLMETPAPAPLARPKAPGPRGELRVKTVNI